MTRVGIVGGGPGGLMTADLIRQTCGDECRVTLFEAAANVGGKLSTRVFGAAPVPYEAGTAECYDYSGVGDDGMRALIDGLGLETRAMSGQAVVFGDSILRDDADVARHLGGTTLDAIREFRERCKRLLPREHWLPGLRRTDRSHAWVGRTWQDLLNTVADPRARAYLAVTTHSDLATEPHLTSALHGLRAFVKCVPGTIGIRSVDGGISGLGRKLRERIDGTRVLCGTRVSRIEQTLRGWRLRSVHDGRSREEDFDALVIALPVGHLGSVAYAGPTLRRAIQAHIARFDRPGHYLRVSMLFQTPFWRDCLSGSWFMVDTFGGACAYDEGTRYDVGRHGVLGFLIAGSDAVSLMSLDVGSLVRRVLDALPGALSREATKQFREARIHRWPAGVCRLPGGVPRLDPLHSHQPDASRLPGLFLVGDYLVDSTLNGTLRSARSATSLLLSFLSSPRSRTRRATTAA